MTFAEWLAELKKETKIPQVTVGEWLGVSQGYVAQLGNGGRVPTDEMVQKIKEKSGGKVTEADWPKRAKGIVGAPNHVVESHQTRRIPLDMLDTDQDDLDETVVASIAESFVENHIQIGRVIVTPTEGDRYIVKSGNHRVAAAKRVGLKALDAAILPSKTEAERIDLELICISENLDRRVLSASRLGELHAKRKALYEQKHPDAPKQGGDRRSNGHDGQSEVIPPTYAEDAAAKSGVSDRHVRRLVRIGEEIAPELHDKVRGTKLDEVKELTALAGIPESKRAEIVEKALTGEGPKPSIALKQQDYKARQAVAAGRQQEIKGKYGCIYLDPPTEFVTRSQDGKAKGPETAFSTMTWEKIREIPVGDMAHDDAFLFFWTTGTMMWEAMRTAQMWGFTYAGRITWIKETKAGEKSESAQISRGTGYRFIECSETLLVFYRGNVIWPAPGLQWQDVLYEPRSGAYSRKPEAAYDLVEAYAGPLTKLELFQRDLKGAGARPGWTVWGSESSPDGNETSDVSRETPSDGDPAATQRETIAEAGAEATPAAATVVSAPPIGSAPQEGGEAILAGPGSRAGGKSASAETISAGRPTAVANPSPASVASSAFDLGPAIPLPSLPPLPGAREGANG